MGIASYALRATYEFASCLGGTMLLDYAVMTDEQSDV